MPSNIFHKNQLISELHALKKWGTPLFVSRITFDLKKLSLCIRFKNKSFIQKERFLKSKIYTRSQLKKILIRITYKSVNTIFF